MRKCISGIGLGCLILVFYAGYTLADTQHVADDTYTSTSSPSTNFGTSTVISVLNSFGRIHNSYLRFDLSALISPGTTVSKATLRLFVNSCSPVTGQVDVYLVDPAAPLWNELTLRANNQPALGASIGSITISAPDRGEFVTLNIPADRKSV